MTITPFDSGAIELTSQAIGEAFTGTGINRLLTAARIPIPDVSTKWRRIDAALTAEQDRTGTGNSLVSLLQQVMQPVRWANDRRGFESLRGNLNGILAFAGIVVHEDGQVGRRKAATTHDEAVATSRRLRDAMTRRGGHAEVFKYCSTELVAEDCFSVVLEATKGLAERVRDMTGLDEDGHKLVNAAFEGNSPMVVMNALQTDTERNEQRGLANIIKGIFSAFRNPTAHEPKLTWHVSEADALDLLCTLSLIHRRLDKAVVRHRVT
jgi:uncharacterized protein (TIGR02391 family)